VPTEPPPRLGDLAETQLFLRVDCRRCGHFGMVNPWSIIKRKSPVTPWRWLRFRCDQCGSKHTTLRAGTEAELRNGPIPLYAREDIKLIVAAALRRSITFLDEGKARAAADTILRGLMAEGAEVIMPERPDPPAA